ncbi:MAG: hypothetical protein LUC95_01345 [Lachnospiraceae bacterium]|nr:hypothetical protein [Lachnospiraceae bacterium]
MQKYYGVYAYNGLGVFSSYAKLMDMRPNLVHEKIRGFCDMEDAEFYAAAGFEGIYGIGKSLELLPGADTFCENHFYYYYPE